VATRVPSIMAWRKSGVFHPAEEILVLTCDVCERDVGHEDGRRAREHFRVSVHPNPGAIDAQQPTVVICSRECLRAFAARTPGPDRTLSFPERRRRRSKSAG
jgi:hypothetical protein